MLQSCIIKQSNIVISIFLLILLCIILLNSKNQYIVSISITLSLMLFCIYTYHLFRKCYKSVWLNNYLKLIYPSYNNICLEDLNFYYSCYPKNILEYYGTEYISEKNNYKPPPKDKLWTPIWFPSGALALNKYDPNKWWEYKPKYKSLNGITNSNWVEIMHTPDDNPYYPVFGYWVYQTTGSGVFMNLGNTLVVPNKITALYKLGFSLNEIVQIIKDTKYMINIQDKYSSVNDVSQKLYPDNDILVSLKNLIIDIIKGSKNYLLDRVNNSADWDKIIVENANLKGYDSVQFTVQANGMGGWAHEIVFTGISDTNLQKKVEKTWNGWPWVQARLRNGLKLNNICTFNPNKNYQIVTCQEQKITNLPNCIKKNNSSPNYY